MNPFYILTFSSRLALLLSTSDIRFGLPFGLSDENNVLAFIPCLLHTSLTIFSLIRSLSNRYKVFVLRRYP